MPDPSTTQESGCKLILPSVLYPLQKFCSPIALQNAQIQYTDSRPVKTVDFVTCHSLPNVTKIQKDTKIQKEFEKRSELRFKLVIKQNSKSLLTCRCLLAASKY